MAKSSKNEKSKKPSHSAQKDASGSKTGKSTKSDDAPSTSPSTLSGTRTASSEEATSTVNNATYNPSVGDAVLAGSSEVNADDEVILTDAEGRRYCRSSDCDQVGLVDGYCRFHYLFYWKKIQNRKKILADGKLERYIEELTARYIDKFVEMLRKDLRTEKDFLAAVQELELDDSSSNPQDEDEAKTYIEEISGMSSDTGRDDDSF